MTQYMWYSDDNDVVRRLIVCRRAGKTTVLIAGIALDLFDYAFVLWIGFLGLQSLCGA